MKHVVPVWIAGLVVVSPAFADTQVPAARAAASRDQQVTEAPLTPRWQVRTVTISGLTVWTYKPGHFVRESPRASAAGK